MRPPVVGLLGGVGAGKSTVAKLLQARGAAVLDADREARAALEESSVGPRLVEIFGPAVLDSDGKPVRERIAAEVFGPEGRPRREALEALIHPLVRDRLRAGVESARLHTPPPAAIVFDVPLLIEGPLKKLCDRLLFVASSEETRSRRTQENRGWSPDEAARRETHQASIAAKRAAADLVVENDGDLAALEAAIDELWPRLVAG